MCDDLCGTAQRHPEPRWLSSLALVLPALEWARPLLDARPLTVGRAGRGATASSRTQFQTATLAGKPMVLAASATTCSISARLAPASRALRTPEWTAPSRKAPIPMASFSRRWVLASRGPLPPSSLTRSQAFPRLGKRRTNCRCAAGGRLFFFMAVMLSLDRPRRQAKAGRAH